MKKMQRNIPDFWRNGMVRGDFFVYAHFMRKKVLFKRISGM